MLSSRAPGKLCSPKQAAQLARTVLPLHHTNYTLLAYPAGLRILASCTPGRSPSPRCFSTTAPNHLKDFFPEKETGFIRTTPPAWPHPGYTEEELLAVVPAHREPKTFGERVAWRLIRLCRWGMDFVTGLGPEQQVSPKHSTTSTTASQPLTEGQWVLFPPPLFQILPPPPLFLPLS